MNLAAFATARTGFLFASKGEVHRVASSTDFGLAIKPFVESGMARENRTVQTPLAARHARFLTEAELYPAGDSADDPSYRNMLYPRGLGMRRRRGGAGQPALASSISLEREFARGPVERRRVDSSTRSVPI